MNTGRGEWLSFQSIGLALFVDKTKVVAMAVFVPTAAGAVATEKPQTLGPSPSPPAPVLKGTIRLRIVNAGPALRGAGFVISGIVQNVSDEHIADVALEIQAERGGTRRLHGAQVDFVYAGSSGTFASAVITEVITSFTVRVVSYETYRGEALDATDRRVISSTFYQNALGKSREELKQRCEFEIQVVPFYLSGGADSPVRSSAHTSEMLTVSSRGKRDSPGHLNVSFSWSCPVVPFLDVKGLLFEYTANFAYLRLCSRGNVIPPPPPQLCEYAERSTKTAFVPSTGIRQGRTSSLSPSPRFGAGLVLYTVAAYVKSFELVQTIQIP